MKDSRAAVAWQKWSDVQLGDWRDVSHSESFYAGYEAAEDELAQLREKLAAAEEKRDMWLRIAQRLFKERQTMLHGHVYDLPTDDVILEATILEAIIDGKEAK